VQRLGETVTITTVPRSGTAHRVVFDWRDFSKFDSLDDVPVSVVRVAKPNRAHGTVIRVTNLRDGGEWAADKIRLANELSKLISPFEGVDRFRLVTVVDGERLDLADIGERMRNASLVHYDFNFDGTTLEMQGRMKLALLRPPKKADRSEFIREIEADRGRELRDFLLSKPQAADFNLRRSTGGWFLEFDQTVRLDELPGVVPPGAVPASPGPFAGEIDGYSLARPAVDEQEVFSTASEFKGLIQALAGIRVYRNGFGVRVGDDWLQLGRSWSTGTSWYGLKPQSSLGYVSISARDNAQLVETTDREGFKETAAFVNLRILMKRFIKFSEDLQGFIGRQTVEFKDQLAHEPDDESLDDAVANLEAALDRGRAYAMEVGATRETLAQAVVKATDLADDLDDEDPVSIEVREVVGAVTRNVTAANVLLEQLESYTTELSGYASLGRDLQARHAAVEQQLDMAYETIGLGLTAESLAHEIKNIADRLAHRTSQLKSHLKRSDSVDRRTQSFVDHVQTTVAALRRQMAHLDPSLRYVRERRESIAIGSALNEMADFHRSRWRDRELALDVVVEVQDDLAISMNRGKFQQIIDNLIFNAEYWLLQDLRRERIDKGIVHITIAAPAIEIADNGLGVEPTVESSLFEPFVSAKPTGEGRGLGLFIVRRLLESEGCDISLLRARNASKRRYRFQLDLGGASVR
jgi:signal transduction histidine kinase